MTKPELNPIGNEKDKYPTETIYYLKPVNKRKKP